MMQLEEKMILVVGFGRTGKSAIRFLLSRGARVTVNDIKTHQEVDHDFSGFKEQGAAFVLGSHPVDVFKEADLIVISPGIDPTLPALVAAREQGIPIISEIELAFCFMSAPIVGITGTNGKTTTATLIAELLRGSNFSVYLGGNIGAPLIDFVTDKMTADYVVAELSSFQLEGIKTFRPYIAVLLNITEDHLNRYVSFESYRSTKHRIFMNQTEHDLAIINYDDPNCRRGLSQITARKLPFSQMQRLIPGIYGEREYVSYRGNNGSVRRYDLSKVALFGPHNKQNLQAAIGAAEECGCSPVRVQEVLETFKGLEHRLEFVREIDHVPYYNDSKSTTIDSLLKALQSFDGNIILIAGGREKGGDYSILKDAIQNRTKMLITIGEAQEKFNRLFASLTDIKAAIDIEESVALAFSAARPGDIVLFSPGCASFDMFSNYEERGQVFKAVVHECATRLNERQRDYGEKDAYAQRLDK